MTEVVNRLDDTAAHHPRLGLDQVDNVRPVTVPTWLVANFFYHFMSQALRRFALPLAALFLLLHLPLAALLSVLSAFLGHSLQRAVGVYGGRPAGHPDPDAASTAMTPVLDRHAPHARILLAGHTHQASLTRIADGRVLVDAGCWVRALVPARSRLGLPPVFAPTYPCTWAEVRPGGPRSPSPCGSGTLPCAASSR